MIAPDGAPDGRRTLFLMVARGGSKGIPGKNLKPLAGRSLIAWKAAGARRSRYCDRILLSTDSEAIREEARAQGVDAPFLRPAHLATDEASSTDVVAHAMDWVEANEGRAYDEVMLLEPTAPFTRPTDYDGAIDLLRARDAALVVGMREVEVNPIFVGPLDAEDRITRIMEQMEAARGLRRQDQPTLYTMNAALYCFTWDSFRRHGRIYAEKDRSHGWVMDDLHSVEIDRPVDLAWAEFVAERGLVDTSIWQ